MQVSEDGTWLDVGSLENQMRIAFASDRDQAGFTQSFRLLGRGRSLVLDPNEKTRRASPPTSQPFLLTTIRRLCNWAETFSLCADVSSPHSGNALDGYGFYSSPSIRQAILAREGLPRPKEVFPIKRIP